jgi:RHS repeat-associated core domain
VAPKEKGKASIDMRAYNPFGELVQIYRDAMRVHYVYRPDGLRHSKQQVYPFKPDLNQKTTHYWDGQDIVAETNATGAIKATYLRGAGAIIAQVIGQDLFYYLHNAHGDVVQRIAENGTSAPKYKYDAFGNERNLVITDPNPFRYCGEYYDAELQEIYLRARSYDPSNGCFTQEDPAHDGNNWYGYANNNPVRFKDPSGRAAVGESSRMPKLADAIITGIITGITLETANTSTEEPAKNSRGKERIWTISNEEFLDPNGMSLGQIYRWFENNQNPVLQENAFWLTFMVFDYAHNFDHSNITYIRAYSEIYFNEAMQAVPSGARGINPIVILATLQIESSSGTAGSTLFGDRSRIDDGTIYTSENIIAEFELQLDKSVNTYLYHYYMGSYFLENDVQDYHTGNDLFRIDHEREQGSYYIPVNAAMFARGKYNTEELAKVMAWQALFRQYSN